MRQAKLLVVDDEPAIRSVLRSLLEGAHYRVLEAASGEEALEHLDEDPDLVLLDYRLPDLDGFEVLRRVHETSPQLPVVMMTGHASIDHAVSALRAGAVHYARKPLEADEVLKIVSETLKASGRLDEPGEGEERLGSRQHRQILEGIVGQSPAIMAAKELLARVAGSPASTVLITGESGTGKDLAAKALHQMSARAPHPFMNITCSALPATLLESELFGHEAGAFTDARSQKIGLLERAHQGTVFLDEIGELELSVQAKLLRFLEDKTFRRVGGAADITADVRIIAATNVDLNKAVREQTFRSDLYYRLAVLTIHLPPLRDRERDLEHLVRHFVESYNRQLKRSIRGVSPDAMALLARHVWPGNIRELRNVMERAILLSKGPLLEPQDFQTIPEMSSDEPLRLPPGGIDLHDLEKSLVKQAIQRTRGNRTKAGALLGLNRDQIRYRIEKYGLESGMR
jgi:two-component system response regulator AtoC